MTTKSTKSFRSTAMAWAHFRFSVIGSLLAAPPARGALRAAMEALASKTWIHPVHGGEVRFAVTTIEAWYFKARREQDDPVSVLRRAVRKDAGKVTLASQLMELLQIQYGDYPHWSYQLHYDNLVSRVKADPSLGPLGSYCRLRRYMQSQGLFRRPRLRPKARPGELLAEHRRQTREIRSYEAEYVGSLWHLDFHHGSLPVVTPHGRWQRPIILCILDDHSRLCCHAQWYLSETAEDLVHGLSQAIQKRGLPRAQMTDNGSAMLAEEFREGLLRLGILHQPTLPYSAYQNGKQESFWGNLEGRLMEMLSGRRELTLDFLNQATQAWSEMEYNRAVHRELKTSPVERFRHAPGVLRSSPSSAALRDAFRLQTKRRQRTSDGTISLEGDRFEIPSRFRHFRDVYVRYARWDLSRVDLVDPHDGTILAAIYPLDRTANADGQRRVIQQETTKQPDTGGTSDADKSLPPLLQRLLDEYAAGGSPPNYLPKNSATPPTPPATPPAPGDASSDPPSDSQNDSRKGTNS